MQTTTAFSATATADFPQLPESPTPVPERRRSARRLGATLLLAVVPSVLLPLWPSGASIWRIAGS